MMTLGLERLELTVRGGRRALGGVTLQVRRGERVAVIGPSGAGKSSLLRVLGTAVRHSSGELRIGDTDPWTLPRKRLRALRHAIGTVHQAPALPPRQRVVTAVLAGRLGEWGFWRSLASLVYPVDVEGAQAALARLALADRLFDRCDRLSGGELQRVGVARVLYQRPAVILADEPVSALDPQLADHTVGELSREAQERGVTLVASLHAVDLALKWFPRIVGLRDGAVAFDLPPVRVSEAMLRELYGSESPGIPTQDYLPLERRSPIRRPGARGQPLCR